MHSTTKTLKTRRTALARAAAGLSLALLLQSAMAQTANFDIAAQPLALALGQFARQTGLQLVFTPALAEGKQAPGVVGTQDRRQALDALLRGSGLQGRIEGGTLTVQPAAAGADASTLKLVTVTAGADRDATAALQKEGKAKDGYRVKTVSSLGALGSLDLQDTPFSISVVPQELIQNIQAQSTDDIYKLNPSTRTITAQGTGWTPIVSIRGFQSNDTAEDGLRRPNNHAAVIEDKERVEVLNGLSGFLYGAAAPAGMVNYVYKRPTVERLNSITVGNYGGRQAYVHGDFGGRLDEAGRVGYRLNVVKQKGNTAVDDQSINRELVSGAIDWQLTDKLLLELNAVYNSYKTQSPSAYWFYGAGIPRGNAHDAEKNWSQPWIQDEFQNTKLTGKLIYRLNDQVVLRGAYTRNNVDRPVQDHTMNNVISATQYRQLRQRAGATKDTFDAAQALADISFATGSIAHKLTVGYHEYSAKSWATTYAPNTTYLGPYALSSPTYVPEAIFPANTSSPYYAGETVNKNFVIGDSIKFSEQWSALAGISRSQIFAENFNALGVKTQADYDKARSSPSLSVMFKPVPWLTTYASYIEGLEMGGRAPASASNSGSIMPPMVSKQKETGIKANVGAMLLTAAVFDIEKAYEYTGATNVYAQSGRQNHQGAEFTATGKLAGKLTLLGGLTVLDTAIKGGANDGKESINVAKLLAKIYAEYELPVPGLSLTGGVYHTGKQWANVTNMDRLPAYTTMDLGVRYATKVGAQPLTLRLSVGNVANKSYWANAYYVGAPRSIAFSAQMPF